LLVHPEAIALEADLCFSADVFYVFVCHGISKLRRPIVTKFCTVICSRLNFANCSQKFGSLFPQQNLLAKNMQILARFWMTLEFDGEYVPNGGRYLK